MKMEQEVKFIELPKTRVKRNSVKHSKENALEKPEQQELIRAVSVMKAKDEMKLKYRVLIAPLKNEPWPKELRIGAGAKTFALLETVPIWFELWRQLNGFPPNFYQPVTNKEKAKK